MGRIIAQVSVQNALDLDKGIEISALVDTGAAYLSLPMAWMEKFGGFQLVRDEELINATGETVMGKLAGPVAITIGGFKRIHSDVLFVDMKTEGDGKYEPLLGYIPMEQANIAVDMLGHRLISARRIDLK